MKKILFWFLLIALVIPAFSQQQVSKDEAINAAINKMKSVGYPQAELSAINGIYEYAKNDTVILYEVCFKNDLHVILSGSKSCKPIMGYGIIKDEISLLDTTNLSVEPLKGFLENYMDMNYCCIKNQLEQIYKDEWEALQEYNQRNDVYVVVEPLIKTRWSQSDNTITPRDNHAFNYYVQEQCNSCSMHDPFAPIGCPAVAMGQIMNYWKYPIKNPDTQIPYEWCDANVVILEVSDYDHYSLNSNYIAEKTAVARLLKDIADDANTVYCALGLCQSGSIAIWDQKQAFHKYGYKNAEVVRQRYHWNTWGDMMKNELDNGRPICYRVGINRGHFVVMDGYDSDEYFHVNLGLGIGQAEWKTFEQIADQFGGIINGWQCAIINIYPTENASYTYCDYLADQSIQEVPSLIEYYRNFQNQNYQPYDITPRHSRVLKSVTEEEDPEGIYRTIPNGKLAAYKAKDKIILTPGFHAEYGSNFTATIEDCKLCNGKSDIQYGFNNGSLYDELNNKNESDNTQQEITIYPNPTTSTLFVSVKNGTIKQCELFSLFGTEIMRIDKMNNGTIDCSNLIPGIYMLKVTTQNGTTLFTKIIKN